MTMGFDQKGFLVFRVQQDNAGKWNVMEVGVEKPLASFDTQMEATEYAHDLGSAKDGSKVEIFNEHGKQIAEVEIAEYDAKDSSR
jgi:hypothetical protein